MGARTLVKLLLAPTSLVDVIGGRVDGARGMRRPIPSCCRIDRVRFGKGLKHSPAR